jgi:RNA polymerase sigma-70 factor, ECF subfamily
VVVASEIVRWTVSSEDDVRAVYSACFDEVYRAAARLAGRDQALAEDLVHDAFVSLVRRARAGTLDEVGVGWLITAVRSRFIDQRRRAATGERSLRLVRGEADRSPTTAGRAVEAVEMIDPIERFVVLMHDVDGYTVKEIAPIIDKSVRATESILTRGRRSALALMGRQRHD